MQDLIIAVFQVSPVLINSWSSIFTITKVETKRGVWEGFSLKTNGSKRTRKPSADDTLFLFCQALYFTEDFRLLVRATSFCRNVILPNRYFAQKSFYWIIVSPQKKNIIVNVIWPNRRIAESSNYWYFIMLNIFPNHCSAERYFPELSYSRTSFSRTVVQPNSIFLKYIIFPNVIFPKLYGAERHFTEHYVILRILTVLFKRP